MSAAQQLVLDGTHHLPAAFRTRWDELCAPLARVVVLEVEHASINSAGMWTIAVLVAGHRVALLGRDDPRAAAEDLFTRAGLGATTP